MCWKWSASFRTVLSSIVKICAKLTDLIISVRAVDMLEVAPMQFINLAATSPHSSKRNQYLIRSHISKSNWQRKAVPISQRQQQLVAEARPIAPLERPADDGEAQLADTALYVSAYANTDLTHRQTSEVQDGDHVDSAASTRVKPEEYDSQAFFYDILPSAATCGAVSAEIAAEFGHTSFGEAASYSKPKTSMHQCAQSPRAANARTSDGRCDAQHAIAPSCLASPLLFGTSSVPYFRICTQPGPGSL